MLEFTALVTGAAVMAVEIVASRILAPFLGNSVIIWSSLIGVILAALSFGYFKGGSLADKDPSVAKLSLLLVIAAVLSAFIALAKNFVLTGASRIPDIRVAATIAEVVLFAPVSFVLAMVSPYVVRLKIKQVGEAGATVGRLYAISTIGSILGTFGAGFFLLSLIGSTAILFCIAGALLLTSMMLGMKSFRGAKLAGAAAAAVCLYAAPGTSVPYIQGKHILETDTHYNHCLVYEGTDYRTKRPTRNLVIDRYSRQSSIFTDRNDDLVLEYLKYFRMDTHFNPQADRALLLGGGAFTFVRDFYLRNPDKALDVVELDPDLEGIAKQYFELTPHPRFRTFSEDARVYLNRCPEKYDVMYLDTFGSAMIVPYYLTTKETAQMISNALSPKGIAMLNLVTAINGPNGEFFRAELATFRSVFPRVEVFSVFQEEDEFRNVLVVAFKDGSDVKWTSGDPQIATYLSHRWTLPVANDMPVLTDDFAPVEIYLARRYERRNIFDMVAKKLKAWL